MKSALMFRYTACLVVAVSLGVVSPTWSASAQKTIEVSYESPALVRKGSIEITLADFVAYMDSRVPAEDQVALIMSPARIEGILQNIALTEAFWQRAEERGMTDDIFFQSRLYQAVAAEARIAYRDLMYSEIELDSYYAQAREMFLVQPERFRRVKTVDMEHILVSVGEERNEIDAMKRIIEAHERLIAGESLASVAEELSDDPTFAQNQGLLEDLEVSALVPSVASAVDSLKIGEYSFPIQSRFGWHIIRVMNIDDAGQMSWEEAKPIALEMARNQHLVEAWERILREVNSAPMQFSDGAVQTILNHYGLEGFTLPEPAGANEPSPMDQ